MNNQHKLSFLNTAARLMDVLEALDEIHAATSEQQQDTLNARGQAELVAMLREIAYVANETADELDEQAPQPVFRLVKGKRAEPDSETAVGSDDHLRLLVHEDTPFYVMKRAGS